MELNGGKTELFPIRFTALSLCFTPEEAYISEHQADREVPIEPAQREAQRANCLQKQKALITLHHELEQLINSQCTGHFSQSKDSTFL